MDVGDGEVCPACGTVADGDPWCSSCGLELTGTEAEQLRSLAGQLAAAEGDLEGARRRRDHLATQLSNLRFARQVNVPPVSPPVPAPGWPPAAREKAEWNVERVRNVLLWTGAALLALSALAFTAVAWTHLGPGGRAALLVAITIVCAFGAIASARRLPATSGALTGLTIALALVDWQIGRRAGVAPGVSGTAWWSIGTALVSVLSMALGRVASPVPARRGGRGARAGVGVRAVAATSTSAWHGALGLSVLAALLVAVDRLLDGRVDDPVVHALLRIEAVASWALGALVVVGAAAEPNTFVKTLTPAAVMLTFALAPALARRVDRVPIAVIAPFVGAALTLESTSTGPVGRITFAVVLGAVAVAIAPSLREPWRRAAQIVGVVSAAPGMVLAGVVALIAEVGPTAWLAHAWTGAMGMNALAVVAGPDTSALHELGWSVVGILAVVALAIPCALRSPAGARPAGDAAVGRAVGAGVLFVAISLIPLVAGASVAIVCTTAAAEVVGARRRGRCRPPATRTRVAVRIGRAGSRRPARVGRPSRRWRRSSRSRSWCSGRRSRSWWAASRPSGRRTPQSAEPRSPARGGVHAGRRCIRLGRRLRGGCLGRGGAVARRAGAPWDGRRHRARGRRWIRDPGWRAGPSRRPRGSRARSPLRSRSCSRRASAAGARPSTASPPRRPRSEPPGRGSRPPA